MINAYRPSKDEYFMVMAMHAATRASCARRRVGCVLVNSRHHVLSTGMNGPDKGAVNCTDSPCPGASACSGEDLGVCEAIHAEINAMLQCGDVYAIDTAYVTTSPCIDCTKALLNTSCKRIVYLTRYAAGHDAAIKRWEDRGRVIHRISKVMTNPIYMQMFCNIYGMEMTK